MDRSLAALIKEAGLNTSFNALEPLDTRTDGRVTWEEFHLNLKNVAVAEVKNMAAEEVKALGNVEVAEAPTEETAFAQLKEIFERIGASEDGSVSKVELAAVLVQEELLGKSFKVAKFTPKYGVFEHLDTQCHERITWKEFEAYLHTIAAEAVQDNGVTTAVALDRVDAGGPRARKDAWCC